MVDAADGAPIEGAHVMAGDAPRADLQGSVVASLRGRPGVNANNGVARAAGVVRLRDYNGGLTGPASLTAGAEGYENVTLSGLDASEAIIALRRVDTPRAPQATVGSRLTQFDDLGRDGTADAGIVLPSFDINFLSRLSFGELLTRNDCWDPITRGIAGGFVGPVPTSGSLYIPQQPETVFGLPVTLEEHPFTITPYPQGTDHLVGLAGKVPTQRVADVLLADGATVSDILGLLDLQEIGVTRDLAVNGDRDDVTVPLTSALNDNASCVVRNVPAGADVLCATAGDWDDAGGTGRMFPMGLVFATNEQVDAARPGAIELDLTTTPAAGQFREIGYLGAAVARYLSAAPEGREAALSAVIDRGSIDGGGGDMDASGFLGTTTLARDGRSYEWQEVGTDASPDVDICRLEVLRQVRERYDPGACSPDLVENAYTRPVWRAFVAGDAATVTLPELPNNWPRAGNGGFVDPGDTPEADLLVMRVSCLALGDSPGFDFNASNYGALRSGVTHLSENTRTH